MLAALGTVIITSLSGVMAPGPMFTMTLAKSLKSPWAGAQVSLGHAVIEVPLILLIYYNMTRFFENIMVQLVLGVLGGSMIIWMGFDLFRARRKLAREVLKETDKIEFRVSEKSVSKFLGPYRFRQEQVEEKDQIGMVTGLAWTQVGGELLFIETLIMPGKGKLTVTGKLGEVMQESAHAAMSYVRSRAWGLGLKRDFYDKIDLHIHVPEGATPKDGPSAGITMTSAIISALIKMPFPNDLAMTGEITLRGRVLPIGGLKEKLLAAKRGLLTRVIIPGENEKDLKEVPMRIRKGMEIMAVGHMDEVLRIVFGDVELKLFPEENVPSEPSFHLKQ